MAAAEQALRARRVEMDRLRTKALDESVSLYERARAVVDRLHLVDEVLSEQLRELDEPDGRQKGA